MAVDSPAPLYQCVIIKTIAFPLHAQEKPGTNSFSFSAYDNLLLDSSVALSSSYAFSLILHVMLLTGTIVKGGI